MYTKHFKCKDTLLEEIYLHKPSKWQPTAKSRNPDTGLSTTCSQWWGEWEGGEGAGEGKRRIKEASLGVTIDWRVIASFKMMVVVAVLPLKCDTNGLKLRQTNM